MSFYLCLPNLCDWKIFTNSGISSFIYCRLLVCRIIAGVRPDILLGHGLEHSLHSLNKSVSHSVKNTTNPGGCSIKFTYRLPIRRERFQFTRADFKIDSGVRLYRFRIISVFSKAFVDKAQKAIHVKWIKDELDSFRE